MKKVLVLGFWNPGVASGFFPAPKVHDSLSFWLTPTIAFGYHRVEVEQECLVV